MLEESGPVLDSDRGSVKKDDAVIKETKRKCCDPLWCCRQLVRKVRDLRSDSVNSVEDEERADPQSLVVFNLATTLYIFMYYLQVLGVVTSDTIVNLPELWEAWFGWIRYPSLTGLFPQLRLDTEWQQAVGALLSLFSLPLLLYIIFSMSLNVNGTDLKETTKQLKFCGILLLVGALTYAIGFTVVPAPYNVYLVIIGSYALVIPFYWAFKWLIVEVVAVPMGINRGKKPDYTRIDCQVRELLLIQFVWLTAFAPVVSGWAYFGLFNENLLLVFIGGILGAVVVLYMLLFIIALAHRNIKYDSKHKSPFVSWFDIKFVTRGEIVPDDSIDSLVSPFKAWSWWFQALFMIERLVLVVVGAAVPNQNGGPITLVIVLVFATIVVLFLPYLGKEENIQDQVSRASNLLILTLGIVSTFNEDSRVVIGIVMVALSGLTGIFWIYHFKPKVLLSMLWENIKFYNAVRKWNRKFRFKTVKKYMKRLNYRVKSYEWEALTLKQRLLTMCVQRPPELIETVSNPEEGSLSFKLFELRVEEYSNELDSELLELGEDQARLIRRLGFQAMPTLEKLVLTSVYVDDDACAALVQALYNNHFKNLRVLTLRNNFIGAEGARALSAWLETNPRLEELDLYDNKLGDEGVARLCDGLSKNTGLKRLILWNDYISDIGGCTLFDCLKQHPSLEFLQLRFNKIGLESAKKLATLLAVNTTLKGLGLWQNLIDVEGLALMCKSLKKNTTLEYLDFRAQGETPRFTAEMKNLLANLLQYNNTIEFRESDDKFLMQVRDGAKLLFANIGESGDDQSSSDSDSDSDSDDSDAEEVVVVSAGLTWSKSAWKYAKKGLCCMISSAILSLNEENRTLLRGFVNCRNKDGKTMMDLVLENGVSCLLDAVKALVSVGFDVNQQTSSGDQTYQDLFLQTEELKQWATMMKGSERNRFLIVEGIPIYQNRGTKVVKAIDLTNKSQVVLKYARNKAAIDKEVEMRKKLPSNFGFHVANYIDYTAEYLVLEKAERTLQDIISTESFIARDLSKIREVTRSAAKALQFLNQHKICHMDFKPRNLVQVGHGEGKTQYKLIDLDAAMEHGTVVGATELHSSSAYAAPEVAQVLFGRAETVVCGEVIDAWSFGCMLYEVLTGSHLFTTLERPGDCLLREEDKNELITWISLDLGRTDQVLIRNEEHDQVMAIKDVASDLLRKCLRGEAKKRTGFLNVLSHSFFTGR